MLSLASVLQLIAKGLKMTSLYACKTTRAIAFAASVLLCSFFFVPASLAEVDPEESLICSPLNTHVGQFYYPGDTNNTLAADAAAYLNDRFHPDRVKLITEYVDISDTVYLLSYLFLGGPAPAVWEAGDFNQDGHVDLSDAVAILNYLFHGGQEPGNGELKVTFADNNG